MPRLLLTPLLLFAAAALLFLGWPTLDLLLHRPFYNADAGLFIGSDNALLSAVSNHLVPLMVVVLAVTAFGGIGLRLLRPRHRLAPLAGRYGVMLVISLGLGSGVMVNEVFKNNWGRPRPSQVEIFGGDKRYSPPLLRRTDSAACDRNCSFVSGDASVGFALYALAFAFPGARRRWLTGATAAGSALGLVRMAQGAHFASDVLYSGVFVYLVTATGWWLCYRRDEKETRGSD